MIYYISGKQTRRKWFVKCYLKDGVQRQIQENYSGLVLSYNWKSATDLKTSRAAGLPQTYWDTLGETVKDLTTEKAATELIIFLLARSASTATLKRYSRLPIIRTLSKSNQNRFPLDFLHAFTVIIPSGTRTSANSNVFLLTFRYLLNNFTFDDSNHVLSAWQIEKSRTAVRNILICLTKSVSAFYFVQFKKIPPPSPLLPKGLLQLGLKKKKSGRLNHIQEKKLTGKMLFY